MINVDISNIWTCVTLPELLGSEQQIFDAHQLLRNHEPDGPDFLGWLGMSDSASERLIHSLRRKSEQIRSQSDVLIVCGSGDSYNAARAAIQCYGGAQRNLLKLPQIFFMGESLSGRQWQELQRLLEERDYSLFIISPTGTELAANIAVRGLRWMMERKYGPKAKERISIATPVGTVLHKMGQEEGFELFPMPKQMGGCHSALSAAALLPMTVAGIDPQTVLEGAAEAHRELDIRAFENPAWLYAAARSVLPAKGKRREIFSFFDSSMTELGRWWQRYVWHHEGFGVCPESMLLPGDLGSAEQMLLYSSDVFETMVHFDPISKKIPVEMDWKDYDGLGFLSGRHMDYVETELMSAVVETHNNAGIPILDIHAGEFSAQSLGELFYFFELSSALTAKITGRDPFAEEDCPSVDATLAAMGASNRESAT